MTVTNCTITGYLAVPQTDWADNGSDSDMAPLTGTVSLRPVTVDRKPLAVAPDYDPPAVFAQPVMAFTGIVEDGVLKTVKGGGPGLRVPANDEVLGLERIWYRIDFDLATGAGQKVVIESQYFEAPSTDTTVDLSNILTETGSTITGVVRQAGYSEDILDSGPTGRELVRAVGQADAWEALGVAPAENLPSYVDDVLEFDNYAALPSTGETGKIYVTRDTGDSYRWTGSVYFRISDKVLAAGITDSTATGRAVVTGDAAAGRKALAVAQVFDARNYGVIADGSPHNNIANLRECIAACVAAGGGEIVLPAGVINTSEAMIGETLTADSGSAYVNTGGLPLPYDTSILIRGQGRGVTTLKLSPGLLRAFDMHATADGNSWRGITIRDLTIDRDNITGADLAPSTAITGNVTLPSSTGWVTLPGVPASAFRGCFWAYFPTSNTGTLAGWKRPVQVVGDEVQIYCGQLVYGKTIAAGDHIRGALQDHVIIGNCIANAPNGLGYQNPYVFNSTVTNVLVENVDAINVGAPNIDEIEAVGPNSVVFLNAADQSQGVNIQTLKNLPVPDFTPSITNVTFKNVRVYGGVGGFNVSGGHGCWLNEIWAIDCFHDTEVVTSKRSAYLALNYQFGQFAWFGRGGVIRCVGKRSGDVGLEVDNAWEFHEVDCRWENANTPVYRTNFAIPAATSAGPRTTTLSADASSDASTLTVAALPSGVNRSGLAMIDSELLWYVATNSAGTTWNVWRGLNGSTAASHSASAAVTFVEYDKQRHYSTGSTVVMNSALDKDVTTFCVGSIEVKFNDAYLPLPPLTLRDMTIHCTEGKLDRGQAFWHQGWVAELDIQGVRYTHSGLDASTRTGFSSIGGAFGFDFSRTLALVTNSVPAPAPRIYGRNNRFQVSGSSTTTDSYYAVFRVGKSGYAHIDFDFSADIQLSGMGSHTVNPLWAVNFDGVPLTLAPGSRFGIQVKSNAISGDPAPVAARIGSTASVAMQAPLQLDLDLSEMQFSADSTDSNYFPWMIDPTNVGNVLVNHIKHSKTATRAYGTDRDSSVRVSSDYTVRATDRIVMVDTTSNPVTVTLPPVAGGGALSSAGEPISRGRRVTIVDVGGNAGTNNITIARPSGELIDSAYAAKVLSINGDTITLTAVSTMPGWLSDRTALVDLNSQQTLTGKTFPYVKIGQIQSANGQVIGFGAAPNSLNYLYAYGAPNGSSPSLSVFGNGGDSTIDLLLAPYGAAGAVRVYGTTGNYANLKAGGPDSVHDLNLDGKGTASVVRIKGTDVMAAINSKESTANKGVANGYAPLDSGGKLAASYLPSSAMEWQGVWDASTNTPTLADGTGNAGDVYRVSVAGTRNLGSGSVSYDVGDLVIYDGSVWQRSDSTDAVSSVNGYTGTVALAKADVGLGNVDNTSDANKPVSTATQSALNLKANAESPALTGAVGVASTGYIALYNTADQATNYERLQARYNSNVAEIGTFYAGTGTSPRVIRLGMAGTVGSAALSKLIQVNTGNSATVPFIDLQAQYSSTAGMVFGISAANSNLAGSSGTQNVFAINPTISQSSTAGYTGLLINPTESSTGSGTKRLIDAGVGGNSKFTVDNTGTVSISGTAATLRAGSGSPESTVTAPVGSLYLRIDGGAATTLYVKESGSGNTGWVAK